MLSFSDHRNSEKSPTNREKECGWKRKTGSLCHRSSSFLEICKRPTVGHLNRGKYVWVLGCDYIGRQCLEQAEVRAAVWKDSKGDITCRGDEVQGLVRSGGAGSHKT